MNLTKITTDFILTKHPEFRALPNEVLLVLVKKAAERKRNVSLVQSSSVQSTTSSSTWVQSIARYTNVTEAEIPYKIMKDDELGYSWDIERYTSRKSLFHLLLEHRQLLLKDHKIFEDALSWMEDYENHNIQFELIEYLYTKILTPQNLLDDIKEINKKSDFVFDSDPVSFHICFEDETTWECVTNALLIVN